MTHSRTIKKTGAKNVSVLKILSGVCMRALGIKMNGKFSVYDCKVFHHLDEAMKTCTMTAQEIRQQQHNRSERFCACVCVSVWYTQAKRGQ